MTQLTDEKKAKLIEKIKKCLALGKDPSAFQHEAESAMEMAQRLMEEYNLSVTDVEVDEVVEVEFVTDRSRIIQWKALLAKYVANGFECQLFTRKGRGVGRSLDGQYHPSKLVFIGTKVDVEVAIYVFKYLSTVVERMKADFVKKVVVPSYVRTGSKGYKMNQGKSYAVGIVQALKLKIDEFANRKKETVNSAPITGKEMILVKKDAVAKYMRRYNMTKGTPIKGLNRDAMSTGQEHGAGISIHHGVNGSTGGTRFLN